MAIKPGRHWGFYGLVMVCGWIAPPVACLVRFGIGKDLVICTILTICGYFPGHGYNFYVQNIRNNTGRGRTPKWAVQAGLVKVKDPKAKPKHQWQNRYDERTPHRADGYDDSIASSSQVGVDSWNGRGPMPAPKVDASTDITHSDDGKRKKHGLSFQPWEAEVTSDRVEGGPPSSNSSGYGRGPAGQHEEYYGAASGPSRYEAVDAPSSANAKPSKLRAMVTGTTSSRHRGDTALGAPEKATGDRFSRMNEGRQRHRSLSRPEDPTRDRRAGEGYYDDMAGDVDPWSKSSDVNGKKPAGQRNDALDHNF